MADAHHPAARDITMLYESCQGFHKPILFSTSATVQTKQMAARSNARPTSGETDAPLIRSSLPAMSYSMATDDSYDIPKSGNDSTRPAGALSCLGQNRNSNGALPRVSRPFPIGRLLEERQHLAARLVRPQGSSVRGQRHHQECCTSSLEKTCSATNKKARRFQANSPCLCELHPTTSDRRRPGRRAAPCSAGASAASLHPCRSAALRRYPSPPQQPGPATAFP